LQPEEAAVLMLLQQRLQHAKPEEPKPKPTRRRTRAASAAASTAT
jgi:hypothetical protein